MYSVPLCKPALPASVLRDLVAALNSGNGNGNEMDAFAVFVKSMRQAFAKLVEGEARERQPAQAHTQAQVHGVRQ